MRESPFEKVHLANEGLETPAYNSPKASVGLYAWRRDGWVGGSEISLSHQQLLLYPKMALPSDLPLRLLASIFFFTYVASSLGSKSPPMVLLR